MYNINAVVHNIGVCAGDERLVTCLQERSFDMTISMDWCGRLGVPYQGSKNAIARDIEENSYGI